MLEGLALLVDRRRWRVYYLALGATLLLGVVLPKVASGWDGLEDRFGTALGGDFLAFYTGGRLVLEGRTGALYDMDAQKALQDELLGGERGQSSAFLNPPPFALLMAPLSALPYATAVAAWWALALLSLVLALWLVRGSLARAGPELLFSVVFLPASLALVMGQNSFLSLLLAAAAFAALRREREGLAGLALGAMVIKPQLAIGFAVVLLVKGRWRAIGSACATAAALVALCWVLVPGAWEGYLEQLPLAAALVRDLLPGSGFYAYYQVSVPAALALLVDGVAPRIGDALIPIATLAIAGAIGLRWRRRPWTPGTREWALGFAASVAAGWLASPHLLLYDLTLFLLPGWVAYRQLGAGPAGRPFGGSRFYGLTLLTLLFASLWVPLVSVWLWNALEGAGLPRVVPQGVTVALALWVVALDRLADEPDSREKAPRVVRKLTVNEGPLDRPGAE
jgi:alpha-1,2-mannosyltransferase